MIRTWKCLLGTITVCALLLTSESRAQEIRSNQVGVVRLRPDPLNDTQPADGLYGAEESVWLDDFQPPVGIGVNPVTIPSDNSVGYAVTSNVDDILYRINRTNRHFYGLDDGFTSAHAFIPLRVMNGGTSLVAIDPRVFVNDNGDGGINFGVTARRYFQSSNRVIATSAWVDYDEGHQGGYAQLGVYGAIIGPYLTTSAFANVPVGDREEILSSNVNSRFVGNRLALARTDRVESAYAHYQFEVAAPIPYFSKYGFEYGIGAYALASRADGVEDGFGVSNRIEAQVTEDLTVNTLVTSDGVFGSNVSVNLELTLPNGMPSRLLRRTNVFSKLTASDNRSYRVLTNTVFRTRNSSAIDPKDGLPITVAHIDPNAPGGGTGVDDAFGSVLQFESLPDALQSSFDLVLVRGRMDGSDTNLDTTITLFDCQQLLGTGIPHIIPTTIGPAPLPDLPYGTPLLTNSAAPAMDVVRLADSNVVSGLHIDAGDTAMGINGLDAADFGVRNFEITRNLIRRATVGINIDVDDTVTGMTNTGLIDDNIIELTSDDGVRITYDGMGAPSDTLDLTITDNLFQGTLGQAIDLDLTGSAVAALDISDNELLLMQQNQFITGVNFTASSINDTGGAVIPPDTMGSVGPDHIVEMINNAFAIYDKETGALISRTDDDEFWTLVAGATIPSTTSVFDPRVLYDPTTERWFAAVIDAALPTNNIYIAVSETSDPTGAWNSVQFVADTIDGTRFNDFDTFGMDADGVYISTNNFGAGIDISIYSIPKADLLAPVPTLAGLARFENLSTAFFGNSIQPAVDFGPSDGAELLSVPGFGGAANLVRTDIEDTDTATPTLGTPVNVAVTPFTPAPDGRQPISPDLENVSPRFNSNVVKVGDSIWAVHAVAGTGVTPNSAIQWYEIDANTDAVLQSGLIEDLDVDYLDASISVNGRGDVAIGFTGTGPTLAPSSMAIIGSTTAGTTTFGTPTILKQGFGDYFVDFGSGRNRWGDYGATVLDPTSRNSNHFWTFQEFVPATDQWAVQITELIAGLGGNDGIAIHAGDTSTILAGSDINRNIITGGTGTGLSIVADGAATVNLFPSISDNTITGMGTDGMFFGTAGTATMTIDGDRNFVNGNGRNGLFMQSFDTSVLDVDFRNSHFNENGERGIQGEAFDGSSLIFTFSSPFDPLATEDRNGNGILDPGEDLNGNSTIDLYGSQASNNGAQGINLKAFDTAILTATIDSVLVDPNTDAGISIFTGGSSIGTVDITDSVIIDTIDGADVDFFGEGVVFRATDDSMLTATITDSLIDGNEGAGVRAQADIDAILDLTIDPTIITNNGGDGITLSREGLSILTADLDDVFMDGNTGFGLSVIADGGDSGGDDVVVTSDTNLYSNNLAGGVNYTVSGSANVFATHTLDLVDSNGDAMAMTGDGVLVTTNDNGFFGSPLLTPSVFDSVVVTNNGANGYTFTSNDNSTLITDILSDTLPTSTLIATNTLDGIEVNHGSSNFTSVRIGNAANAFPDVSIFQNLVDAVDLNFTGSGVVDVTIANTLINGARRLNSPSDPGVTVEYTGSDTAQVFIGQDMGPGRDPTTGVRSGVTITDIGMDGDAINVLYDRNNDVTGTMNLFVADSIIGTGAGTIGGDGVEMTVQDNGFTGEFYQNEIRGALGDGIRLDTEAEMLTGATVNVPGDAAGPPNPPLSPQDVDTNNNNIGDRPSANSLFLNALPNWLDDWGDATGSNDFDTTLIVGDPSLGAGFGGNTISGNGESGLEISVGAATTVNAWVRGNTLGGNTDGDFTTSTATNTVATLNTSTNRAEGQADTVVLDPIARMTLFFGDSSYANSGNFTNPSAIGGTWTAGDVFKPAGRDVLSIFTVTLPDETFPPTPNDFLQNGVQENEEATFTAAGFIVIPQ